MIDMLVAALVAGHGGYSSTPAPTSDHSSSAPSTHHTAAPSKPCPSTTHPTSLPPTSTAPAQTPPASSLPAAPVPSTPSSGIGTGTATTSAPAITSDVVVPAKPVSTSVTTGQTPGLALTGSRDEQEAAIGGFLLIAGSGLAWLGRRRAGSHE